MEKLYYLADWGWLHEFQSQTIWQFSLLTFPKTLICLEASLMQRACFSLLLRIHPKQTWRNTGSGSIWANTALILLYKCLTCEWSELTEATCLTAAEDRSQRSPELKARVCPVSTDDIQQSDNGCKGHNKIISLSGSSTTDTASIKVYFMLY